MQIVDGANKIFRLYVIVEVIGIALGILG